MPVGEGRGRVRAPLGLRSEHEASVWNGFFVPSGTPKPIIAALNKELARIVRLPDIDEKLRLMSAEPVGGTPEQLDAFVKSELAKWDKVIKSLNLRID